MNVIHYTLYITKSTYAKKMTKGNTHGCVIQNNQLNYNYIMKVPVLGNKPKYFVNSHMHLHSGKYAKCF